MEGMEDMTHIRLQGARWLELQIGGRARNYLDDPRHASPRLL